MRVLLPVRPENDCAEAARILESLFGHDDVSVLRLFVYRPAEVDQYDPELLTAFTGVRRMTAVEVQQAMRSSSAHCRSLVDHGFHVESAMVVGFPVGKIVVEAQRWKADLIVLHVTREKMREARIGRIVGSLIDASPLPVLIYAAAPAGVPKDIAVVDGSEEARAWAERLARRAGAEVRTIADRAIGAERCDLLVMPARHHFAPSLFGSSERRTVRDAGVPVALIPQ